MEKSGIKSFIFSFVLTLSTVLLVDKMLPDAPKNSVPVKKISYKNIALFSERKDDLIVASTAFSTTKYSESTIKKDIVAKNTIENNIETKELFAESQFENETENLSTEAYIPPVENNAEKSDVGVVYDPNNIVAVAPTQEYTFEELMAMNNVESFDNSAEQIIDNNSEFAENDKFADNSFDENLNLWLPIEKGETKIDIADSSEFSQIAMSGDAVMLSSVIDEQKAKVETFDDAVEVAKTAGNEQTDKKASSPWIVAKGAKYAKNRQNIEISEDENVLKDEKAAENKSFALSKISDGSEARAVSGILNKYKKKPDGSVDVAYKVMDNLLIPIPEEILEDDNLTPQLVASDEDDVSQAKEDKKKNSKKRKSAKSDRKKSTLFESIGSFFNSSKSKKKAGEDIKEYDIYEDDEDEDIGDEENAVKKAAKLSKNKKSERIYAKERDLPEFSEILPTEMKLSFQPEKAEISGTTLRWIRAFAENTKKNPDTYIEIRIDGTGAYALQQRRLNLLQGIFFENGVKPEKINTVFTAREPNSFVIRNIRIIEGKPKTEKKKEKRLYYEM